MSYCASSEGQCPENTQKDWHKGAKTGAPCPRCDIEELELAARVGWFVCPGCFHEVAEKNFKAEADKANSRRASQEARACFEEDRLRYLQPGGSDDGMAVIVETLRPPSDESLVKVTERRQLVRRSRPIRVRGLDCSSAEALVALQEFFERNGLK